MHLRVSEYHMGLLCCVLAVHTLDLETGHSLLRVTVGSPSTFCMLVACQLYACKN